MLFAEFVGEKKHSAAARFGKTVKLSTDPATFSSVLILRPKDEYRVSFVM